MNQEALEQRIAELEKALERERAGRETDMAMFIAANNMSNDRFIREYQWGAEQKQRADAAEARVASLTAALVRTWEWPAGSGFCVLCDKDTKVSDHTPDCIVGNALRQQQ